MRNVARVLHAGTALAAFCVIATPADATDLYFQMNPNYSSGPRQAFIFGTAGASGSVSSLGGFNSSFTLNGQGFATVDVPISYELANQTVQNNGFRISSATAISGYFLSRAPFTTDMSYLIDGSKLGTNYVTASYTGSGNPGVEHISVQAITNGTTVTITPAGGTTPVNVTLNAGQTYMYSRQASLTGSTVTASAPIAVFSGNSCSYIPVGNSACDHLDEQMVSVDQLSTSYLLGKTPRTGTGGDVYRVVASQDGTVVTANGVQVATLNKGEFYEGRVTTGIDVETSKPVLVAQYLIGQSQAGGSNTDPAMTIVPGQDQWLNSYVFATPSGSADFPTDIISLVLRTSDLSSLMVAGAAANTAGFLAIGATGYSYGNIDVSATTGPFSITAANPFQLLLSGYDSFDTYFTYGGARFAPGASPPPPDPGVPEPATWAMMLAGVGAVGYALRRRQKVGTTVRFA